MTPREIRLRERIDTLADERDKYRMLLRRQYERVATLNRQLEKTRRIALAAQLAATEAKAKNTRFSVANEPVHAQRLPVTGRKEAA